MAQLFPPFILCPLSESKEFLGISTDKYENKVILTLGKNIAIRYDVSEQKQEISWTSSRHWFTSRVFYLSKYDKYAAVIDKSTVGTWNENDSHLASLTKHKFLENIYDIKTTESLGTLVIFENGTVRPLTLTNLKKSVQSSCDALIETSTHKIISVEIDEKIGAIFLAVTKKGADLPLSKCGVEKLSSLQILSVKISISSENQVEIFNASLLNSFSIQNPLLGFCILANGDQTAVAYVTPDGLMHKTAFLNSDEESREKSSSRIDEFVSLENPVVLKSISPSIILLYGSDPSEEGAVLFIYDTFYDLLLSKQTLKLFGIPPIMELIGQNVFVPVGLNILVLKIKVRNSLLSSVLARHRLLSTELFETRDPWTEPWEKNQINDISEEIEEIRNFNGVGEKVRKLVKTLESGGQPETAICTQVISLLYENFTFPQIAWCLSYFTHIPESQLISLLFLLLNKPSSKSRTLLLNSTLLKKVNYSQLLPPLRSLPFSTVKKLLSFLSSSFTPHPKVKIEEEEDFSYKKNINCIKNGEEEDDYINEEEMEEAVKIEEEAEDEEGNFKNEEELSVEVIIFWASVVVDAHYAQLVFEEERAWVEDFLKLLSEEEERCKEVEELEPVLVTCLNRVSLEAVPPKNSIFRIERLVFE